MTPRIIAIRATLAIVVFGVMALGLRQSVLPPPAVHAQSLPAPAVYSQNSPHWSHINLVDFGRLIKYLNKPNGTRQAVHDWYARHLDMVEVGVDTFVSNYDYLLPTVNIKDSNPTIKTFGYDYDLSTCQHQGCTAALAAMPSDRLPQTEDEYLHFSEDTTVEFYNLQQQLIKTTTIPGCPVGQSLATTCRMQIYVWSDYRWLPNMANSQWQTWKADSLLNELRTDPFNNPHEVDGLFLDEHGPGFSVSFGIGYMTKILSGGGIREYNGLRPRDPYVEGTMNALDQAYTNDVSTWLSYLRGRLDAAGKFAHINIAEYFSDPLALATGVAVGGAMTEHLNTPFDFSAPDNYQQFLSGVRQITAAGGSVDLAGTWCDATEPNLSNTQPTYTAGNYPTAVERYSMWNLANYYMAKQGQNETGTLYLDTNLCVTELTTVTDLDAQWLSAYETNVGQPTDEPSVIQTGPTACGATYQILSRQYTNARIVFRHRDSWGCNTYGDVTAVTIPLDSPMVMLEPDGTYSAPMTSVSLRNAEAVILFPAPDVTAPTAIDNLRTE